jgi:hypothetical protein
LCAVLSFPRRSTCRSSKNVASRPCPVAPSRRQERSETGIATSSLLLNLHVPLSAPPRWSSLRICDFVGAGSRLGLGSRSGLTLTHRNCMPPPGFRLCGVPLVFVCSFHCAIGEGSKQSFRGSVVCGSEEWSGQAYFLSESSFQLRAWRHYVQWELGRLTARLTAGPRRITCGLTEFR